MEQMTIAALVIGVIALLFVRSLRKQVRSLNRRLEELEEELHSVAVKLPS